MAQFFFHVRQDRTVFEDTRGGEFADLTAAWDWAVDDVRKLIQNGELAGPLESQWIEIVDESGTVVASLPFARAAQLN
jgi:hypothetical protein